MSEAQANEVMDVLMAKEATSKQYTQKFECSHQSITHEHSVEVEIKPERTEELEICNHFTTLDHGRLSKVTEIHFGNRTIKIRDSFLPEPSNSIPAHPSFNQKVADNPKHQRKITLLPKSGDSGTEKSRDTKNVIKNIVRLFQNWLEETLALNRETIQELNQLVAELKYNNKLMLRMARSSKLREAFMAFCRTDAEEFLSNSKILDKGTHRECLEKYIDLCMAQEKRMSVEKPELRAFEEDRT